MTFQEFDNTKKKIRKNFVKEQALILELLLKHIRDIEENERLIKIQLGLRDQTMQLLKENSDLKIAMLTKRLLAAGVPISSEDLLTTYHKKEEVEDDEGVSGTDGVHGMDPEEE